MVRVDTILSFFNLKAYRHFPIQFFCKLANVSEQPKISILTCSCNSSMSWNVQINVWIDMWNLLYTYKFDDKIISNFSWIPPVHTLLVILINCCRLAEFERCCSSIRLGRRKINWEKVSSTLVEFQWYICHLNFTSDESHIKAKSASEIAAMKAKNPPVSIEGRTLTFATISNGLAIAQGRDFCLDTNKCLLLHQKVIVKTADEMVAESLG